MAQGDDVFGWDHSAADKKILTAHDENLTFTINSQEPKIIQNATIQYQQRTEPRFEVGSSRLYWATGQSQGNLQLNKLCGASQGEGFWKPFDADIAESTQKNNALSFSLSHTEAGDIAGDGVFQSVTAAFNVGDMAVQDNAVMSVGNLTKG